MVVGPFNPVRSRVLIENSSIYQNAGGGITVISDVNLDVVNSIFRPGLRRVPSAERTPAAHVLVSQARLVSDGSPVRYIPRYTASRKSRPGGAFPRM